jgi:hypothetical protein
LWSRLQLATWASAQVRTEAEASVWAKACSTGPSKHSIPSRDGKEAAWLRDEDSEFQLTLEVHLGEREDLVHDDAADMRAELQLSVFLRYFSGEGE